LIFLGHQDDQLDDIVKMVMDSVNDAPSQTHLLDLGFVVIFRKHTVYCCTNYGCRLQGWLWI